MAPATPHPDTYQKINNSETTMTLFISRVNSVPGILLLWILLILPLTVFADDEKSSEEVDKEKDKEKTIAELIENSDQISGLFEMYRDRDTGDLLMLIKPEQIDQEFIHFAQVANGFYQSGKFLGQYLNSRVFTLRRHFNRIDLVAENTSYYLDADNPLSLASDANISPSVLAVEKILAEDKAKGEVLIKASGIFLSESLEQIKPAKKDDDKLKNKKKYTIGKLSKAKSRILNVRSYPLNTDIEVEYVYEDPAPRVKAKDEVTDSRNISIRVLHSLIAVPDNDFQPRLDDSRLGYFTEKVTDLTSFSATPYRDLIHRWNLVKKDPGAEVSEPVTPITWWIENTTPHEIRDTIRNAALSWNSSFEKAGFRNAIAVKVQPDDADWDAGDIRYNVLRWTSSPSVMFGGYGPSFVNPRTGQILGADIMLEHSFIKKRLVARELMELPTEEDAPGAYCHAGLHMLQANQLGFLAARATGLSDEVNDKILFEGITRLILHEIGHALGLNHNMKASQLLTLEQVFDQSAIDEFGLTGSVMDYPAVNFAHPGREQTQFYDYKPGAYDDWVITYGYSESLADPAQEAARLETILSRSSEPALAFGNDADDMRRVGVAIDPRVNIFDMSNEAVAYAVERIDLLRHILADLTNRYTIENQSFQELLNGYKLLLIEWSNSAKVISRYVGGIYVDRTLPGQEGRTDPFRPVEFELQQQAMQALAENVFSPQAFEMPDDLYRHLQQQRRGFDFQGKTEDPKIHQRVLDIQKSIMDHLLNPVVLKRITDSRLYGNKYDLSTLFADLNDAIFASDRRANVNTFRQNLQLEYVNRLALMVNAKPKSQYDYPSKSMALFSLKDVQKTIASKRGVNQETKAHVQNLQLVIDRALSVEQVR
jgi:hypothetical protein